MSARVGVARERDHNSLMQALTPQKPDDFRLRDSGESVAIVSVRVIVATKR
jgi:hypothetical protein